jgi:hypothetical protein
MLVLPFAACRQQAAPPITDEIVALNNRAVASMGQFDYEAAVSAFDALRTRHPEWSGARLNYAIALVNRQGPGDAARSETELRALIGAPGVDRRARYMLALLLAHEGRDAEALPLLEKLADETPPDGFAAYFAGQQRLNSAPDEALAWYEKAIAREPLLRSGYYGAFLALRRQGRDEEAKERLARFQALERNPQARVAEFKYTRMGSLAEVITVDAEPRPGAAAPEGTRFLPPVPLAAPGAAPWKQPSRTRSTTVADLNGDGQLDLFVADALDGPSANAVLLSTNDGGWTLDDTHALARVSGVRAAIWGDFDDDGLADVVLCRGAGETAMWRQAPAGRFAAVGAPNGVRVADADIIDGAAFDADHDGDLDLWLVNEAGPSLLLNNDGDLRFRAIAGLAGVAGDGRPARSLAVADLDGDRDADVMVIKAAPPHDVFLNDRVWSYRRDPGAAELAAASMTALIAGDLDADGDPELYSAGGSGITRWRRDSGGEWRAAIVGRGAAGGITQLAVADTSGEGRLELLSASESGWRVHEIDQDTATTANGAEQEHAAAPGGWAIAHLDAGRGPSVVGTAVNGVPQVWRPGPGRHPFLGLAFSGRDPSSNQRRSNVSGIGTRVAVRTGSRWTAFDNTRLESGPGQSLQPMTVGLGGAARADFVALTWSDGVLQTEAALDRGRLHVIGETQRQLSSCPVLFAWDGTRFQFVTDVLGVGGIGFFERPGVYSEPLPRENVLLPEGMLGAADGSYRVRLAEPMEEVTYLDSLSLVAFDLPPGWRMALDERKAVNGPVPTGAPIFYREERLPVVATNSVGDNVTRVLRHADRQAVGAFHASSRFIGLTERHSVTMIFAEAIDRGPGRPVLLIDGWVEYPYAQTMFAAWQAGAAIEAPTLEARDETGRWQVVAREFGYPAGMPRQMAYPIPPLPSGTTALRLRTSQEIYWDRISVVYAESPPAPLRREVLPMRSATLAAVGFARRTTGPQRTPDYDDARRAPLDDTRHPRGWYTEFGAVEPLVAEEDSAVAILGPGEAVDVSFQAPASPPPAGWTRQLVLEARGWCKDMDLLTRDGEAIEPLPGIDSEARRSLHARFNTRYAAGY